jgi:hypothetical protein
MESKFFEIRDRMTFIPMLATRIHGADSYLVRRAGYQNHCVILVNLNDARCRNSQYDWNDRTFSTAHRYILENWDQLESDAVIDVEFILGETKEPKESEGNVNYGL